MTYWEVEFDLWIKFPVLLRRIFLPRGFSETLTLEASLFLNQLGRPLKEHYVYNLVKETRKLTNIRTRATPHSFRKSSATHMLRNGAPLVSVQRLLRHVSASSTEVYTKVYPKDIEKMMASYHPRERIKNLGYLELRKPTKLFSSGIES